MLIIYLLKLFIHLFISFTEINITNKVITRNRCPNRCKVMLCYCANGQVLFSQFILKQRKLFTKTKIYIYTSKTVFLEESFSKVINTCTYLNHKYNHPHKSKKKSLAVCKIILY